MAYRMYFGKLLMPVMPDAITVTVANQNTTVNLINDGEMNILKKPGLKTVKFTLLLPNHQYPFAKYTDGFKRSEYFTKRIQQLKNRKESFRWIVTRKLPSGKALTSTNLEMVVEELTIKENARDAGFDVQVDVTLKEFAEYKTRKIKLSRASARAPIAEDRTRPAGGKPSGDGSGGGGGKKKYKVQIPGMSVVEVWATSVQDAITQACGTNWTGTIYVDNKAYRVKKGMIQTTLDTAADTAADAIDEIGDNLEDLVNGIVDALTGSRTTARSPVTSKTRTTVTKKVSKNLSKKVVTAS